MWEGVAAAGIGALANIGGGIMSAGGAAAANANNWAINNANQTFQNNVNNANWEHTQAINAENWAHAQQTAQQNMDFAREQTASNQQFADHVLAFNMGLSSTAYQRAMQDMKRAGLNPILAYQQGGAATPGGPSAPALGASGSGSTSVASSSSGASMPHGMENTQAEIGRAIGRAAQSAVDAYKTSEDIKTLRTNRELTDQRKLESEAATHANWMDAAKKKEETFKTNAEIDVVKAMKGQVLANTGRAAAEAGESMSRTRNQDAQTENFKKYGTSQAPNTWERIWRSITGAGVAGEGGGIPVEDIKKHRF